MRKLFKNIGRFLRLDVFVPRLLRFNVYTGFISRRFLHCVPFVLPHDRTYHGLAHLVRPGEGLFLDVGANDGISAMGFHHIHRDYHILSIEPNPYHESALKRIKKKIRNFEYKIIGAGSDSEHKFLYIPYYKKVPIYTAASCNLDYVKQAMEYHFGGAVNGNVEYVQKLIEVVRLDDLGLKPDIIKIDAEGFEYQVLLGLENTLKICRPSVIFEFNPRFMNGEINFMKSLGYRFFIYEFQSNCFKAFNPDHKQERGVSDEFSFNIFSIPDGKTAGLPQAV